ncbi:hypothetical protein DFS34DRAFT_644932 [Phlyctochytrium arcticum]|nr:hypothetical protein DFS34DRAFT_644932 [Phlyctochytrium arcticum]
MDEKERIELGIIGMGAMGRMYAQAFKKAGWQKISVCDDPSNFENLAKEFHDSGMNVMRDGTAVSRQSDFIMYCVEAAKIKFVVNLYGPATKVGAIVAGQTSVKEPEIQAFEESLPKDVHIVTCHSMHGPRVNPKNQPLVIIRHRSDDAAYNLVVRILQCLESKMVNLTYREHDRITADTQVATHLAFLSMGTAWNIQRTYPWENPSYIGGMENVKTLMTLRIYSNKWHVYAGLALLNPSARNQIRQYANSVSELFKLMIQEREEEFRSRILRAASSVFGKLPQRPNLLSDNVMDRFSLSAIPKEKRMPNSHLSLLAVVDCWHALGIHPYDHLICQTPPFRMLLGLTEYLFREPGFLDDAIHAALYNRDIRGDDCEFYTATRGWVECIESANFDAYQRRFEQTAGFFKDRLAQGAEESARLIETIASIITANESSP